MVVSGRIIDPVLAKRGVRKYLGSIRHVLILNREISLSSVGARSRKARIIRVSKSLCG